MLMAAFCCLCLSLFAQKEEIRAFEKRNKVLLKELKKQHDAKPTVQMLEEGIFYIQLFRKENGKQRFLLADEAGGLLYPELLDKCAPIQGGYFFVGVSDVGGKTMWGAVDGKGKQLFPIKYEDGNLWHCGAEKAGTFDDSSRTYWHPASEECWVATTKDEGGMAHTAFYAADGQTVLHEYRGALTRFRSYFWIVGDRYSATNTAGLFTNDGKEIFPQQYSNFYIEPSGLANSIKKESDGLLFYGGKMLNERISSVEVPAVFNDVTYNVEEGAIKCRLHRGDEFEAYDPAATYEVHFQDKGERLFDQGKFEDVITFYEGEGYGAPWGCYYMGLAAKEIAQTEMKKMDACITTLKSDTQYWYPIKNPDKYKFDSGTMTTMYLSAGNYLEQYINNPKVPEEDPHKVKAKKLRGEIVKAKNGIQKKVADYTAAYSAAVSKNAEREAAIAAQQAQQQAVANSLATGLTNLLFGGGKKK